MATLEQAKVAVRPSTQKRYGRLLVPGLLVLPSLIVLLVFVIIPLVFMFRYSFYRHGYLVVMEPAFTFENYIRFFTTVFYLEVAAKTLGYALIVTVASLIMGYPVAYFLSRSRTRFRPLLMAIVIVPFTLSLVVSAYGWLALLSQNGIINWFLTKIPFVDEPIKLAYTPRGALIAMSVNFIPYQVLALLSAISNIGRDLEEASYNLGANRRQTFFKVLLPLSYPGILSGCTLVFVLGLTAFIAPRLVGGASMIMLGNLVYDNMIVYLNWPFAAALGFMLLGATMAVFFISNRLLRLEFIERERGLR
ncbi:MAG: ABC transporter permease [Chloroflexi bacterium]|nr:ABC transporter permease [Chloroflexota bacterium]